MYCKKITISNTSDKNIYFNYVECDTQLFVSQALIEPGVTNIFWTQGDSLTTAYRKQQFVVESEEIFSPQTPYDSNFYKFEVYTGVTLNEAAENWYNKTSNKIDLYLGSATPGLSSQGDLLKLWIDYPQSNGAAGVKYYSVPATYQVFIYDTPTPWDQISPLYPNSLFFVYDGWFVQIYERRYYADGYDLAGMPIKVPAQSWQSPRQVIPVYTSTTINDACAGPGSRTWLFCENSTSVPGQRRDQLKINNFWDILSARAPKLAYSSEIPYLGMFQYSPSFYQLFPPGTYIKFAYPQYYLPYYNLGLPYQYLEGYTNPQGVGLDSIVRIDGTTPFGPVYCPITFKDCCTGNKFMFDSYSLKNSKTELQVGNVVYISDVTGFTGCAEVIPFEVVTKNYGIGYFDITGYTSCTLCSNQNICPTPTPTPTITPTHTVTPSVTTTISVTPSVTSTPICPCCEPGYNWMIYNADQCYRIEISPATPPTFLLNTRKATYTEFSAYGTQVFGTGFSLNGFYGVETILFTDNLWINRGGITDGPLNRSGIWVQGSFAIGTWYGFSYCLKAVNQTKTYYVGIAGDNHFRLVLDGQVIVNSYLPGSPYIGNAAAYTFWHIYPVVIGPGDHVLELYGLDTGVEATIGMEIYDNTLNEIINARTIDDLNIVFTSANQRTFQLVQNLNGDYIGGGIICENGVYSFCEDACIEYIFCPKACPTPTPTPTPVTQTPTPTNTPTPVTQTPTASATPTPTPVTQTPTPTLTPTPSPTQDCDGCNAYNVTITQEDLDASSDGSVNLSYIDCNTESFATRNYVYSGTYLNDICALSCAEIQPYFCLGNFDLGCIPQISSYITQTNDCRISDPDCPTEITLNVTNQFYSYYYNAVNLNQTYGNIEVTVSSSTSNDVNQIFVGNLSNLMGEIFEIPPQTSTTITKTIGFEGDFVKNTLDIGVYTYGENFQPMTLKIQVSCPTLIDCPKTPTPTPTPSSTPDCCQQQKQESYGGWDYYVYPRVDLLSSITKNMNFTWTTSNRPSRFSIYDSTGIIWSSGWVGNANYSGPWGASLNTITGNTVEVCFNSLSGRYIEVEAGPVSNEIESINEYSWFLLCNGTCSSSSVQLKGYSDCGKFNPIIVYSVCDELQLGCYLYVNTTLSTPYEGTITIGDCNLYTTDNNGLIVNLDTCIEC